MKQLKPLVLAIAAFAALGTAHAQQDPGITDKAVKIGVFAPLSGNSMAYGFDVLNAAKMYYMTGGEFNVPMVFRGANGAAAQVRQLVGQDRHGEGRRDGQGTQAEGRLEPA